MRRCSSSSLGVRGNGEMVSQPSCVASEQPESRSTGPQEADPRVGRASAVGRIQNNSSRSGRSAPPEIQQIRQVGGTGLRRISLFSCVVAVSLLWAACGIGDARAGAMEFTSLGVCLCALSCGHRTSNVDFDEPD